MGYLVAGARTVQIGRAGVINPHTYSETVNGMRKGAEDQGATSISEVVGSFRASQARRWRAR